MSSDPAVPDLFHWLRAQAWPRWLEQGVDWPRRGFRESLALDGSGCPATFRRLRVAARQVYVFAQARQHGVPRADEAVALGLEFLRQVARQPDGGYAWRFSLDHEVLDDRRDLYDHAFVLLALAAAQHSQPAPALHAEARALDDYLQRHFRHPAGGYRESLPDALPRRQNPHMHLLEAQLAAARAFGDAAFLERAHALVDLLLARLLDHATGTLPEWFDADLEAQRDGGRHRLEPGHLCEWIWLLDDYQHLTGGTRHAGALREVRTRFAEFVARHGSLPGRTELMDETWSDGAPSLTGARLWPQAERLKAAWVAQRRAEATPGPAGGAAGALGGAGGAGRDSGDSGPRGATEACARQLASWLREDGLWQERRTADGAAVVEPAPASSLYHLTCAILCVQAPSADSPLDEPGPGTPKFA